MSIVVEHVVAISVACLAFAWVARDWVRVIVGKPTRGCEGCGVMKIMEAAQRGNGPIPPSALVRTPRRTRG